MTEHRRLLELALKGLEIERNRIQEEIREIESQIRGSAGQLTRKKRTLAASLSEKGTNKTAQAPRKRRRMSAAARKKLSDAAKRRWIASKKAGKSTL